MSRHATMILALTAAGSFAALAACSQAVEQRDLAAPGTADPQGEDAEAPPSNVEPSVDGGGEDARGASSDASQDSGAGPLTPFTLVVMPDTQVTTYKWPADYDAQVKWIAATRAALNTQYVLHVGDLQEWPKTISYYVTARKGMDVLAAAGIPFTIAIGNHDFDKWSDGAHAAIAKDRSTTIFNGYFPRSEAAKLPTFGGSYPSDALDNNYHRFRAGGTDWMTLTLNYQATDAEIAWANEIVAANPDRRVILVTHDYMDGGAQRDAFGQKLWQSLVRKHANLAFVLCGHLSTASRRVDKGDHGNDVIQILSDYQNYDVREPNSYLRTMTFDPAARRVTVKTYSPAFDKSMAGDAHDFVLEDVAFGTP